MKEMNFNEADLKAFAERGLTEAEVRLNVERLRMGSALVEAKSACVKSDGISQIDEIEANDYVESFQKLLKTDVDVLQFVPASGAASRMFKALKGDLTAADAAKLEAGWERFAFSKEIGETISKEAKSPRAIAHAIVSEKDGLGLAAKPKGCVPFHRYPDGETRTSFQEHAEEWRRCTGGKGRMIFTIQLAFEAEIQANLASAEVKWRLQAQHPATDLLAWDLDADALLRDDGALVWRPGGHGALLRNLEETGGDLVFIRNIDNVVDEQGMALRNRWQAVLGARANAWRIERDACIASLKAGHPDAEARAATFLSRFIRWGAARPNTPEEWIAALNRPIRVAGMVRNAGQPGGGPFWIRGKDGHLRPGIAEKAELGEGLMESGTHFNPVELACVMKDSEGERFDLAQFADHDAFFTAEKTHGIKSIRILERPGLWNGGMALWLTEFVELPSATFAPVKTVFDLLDRNPQRA